MSLPDLLTLRESLCRYTLRGVVVLTILLSIGRSLGAEPDLTSDDPFKILGINRGATELEIRKAWRNASILYHPDRADGTGSDALFIEITKARDRAIKMSNAGASSTVGVNSGSGSGNGDLPDHFVPEPDFRPASKRPTRSSVSTPEESTPEIAVLVNSIRTEYANRPYTVPLKNSHPISHAVLALDSSNRRSSEAKTIANRQWVELEVYLRMSERQEAFFRNKFSNSKIAFNWLVRDSFTMALKDLLIREKPVPAEDIHLALDLISGMMRAPNESLWSLIDFAKAIEPLDFISPEIRRALYNTVLTHLKEKSFSTLTGEARRLLWSMRLKGVTSFLSQCVPPRLKALLGNKKGPGLERLSSPESLKLPTP